MRLPPFLRRHALWILAVLATASASAAVWLASGSLIVTTLTAVSIGATTVAVAAGAAKAHRAWRALARQARTAERSHTTELSRVLYHARRGADAAVAARSTAPERPQGALSKSLVDLTEASAALAERLDRFEATTSREGSGAATAAHATRSPVAAPARKDPLPPAWALEREFDLPTAAPDVMPEGAMRLRALLSPVLERGLRRAATLIPAHPGASVEPVDAVMVSDAALVAEYRAELEPRDLAQAMLSRIDSLAASAPVGVGRIAWIESRRFSSREIEYIASACDLVVLPRVATLGQRRNQLVCEELLDLRALTVAGGNELPEAQGPAAQAILRRVQADASRSGLDSAAVAALASLLGAPRSMEQQPLPSDLVSLMKAEGLWTPRTLVGAIGELLGKPQPTVSSVTSVTRIGTRSDARLARELFATIDRSLVSRQVLVVDATVPSHLVMQYMREFAHADTVVTSQAALASPEGRRGLIPTGYALLAPPDSMPSASRLRAALAVAEASQLPIALTSGNAALTLCDPQTTPLLTSPMTALRAIRSRDRLTPVRTLETA